MAHFQLDSTPNRNAHAPSRLLVVPMAWERWALWGGVWAGRRRRIGDVQGWEWGDWFVVSPGIGLARSRALAARLNEPTFKEVWLAGICGGLNSQLEAGDLIQVPSHDEPCLSIPASSLPLRELGWQELPIPSKQELGADRFRHRIYSGTAVCSERILSQAEKLELAKATRGAIVEMESLAWQEWSIQRQVPLVHLRIVSDPVGSEPIVWSRFWRSLGQGQARPAPTIPRPTRSSLPSGRTSRWHGLLPRGIQDILAAASTLRQLGVCLEARRNA